MILRPRKVRVSYMNRDGWERELGFLHRNLAHYLTHWPTGHEGWSPVPGKSFTLLELASHLYILPLSYAAILGMEPEAKILKLQGGPWAATGPADLLAHLNQGMDALGAALRALSDADFASKPVPWPFGEPVSPESHLLSLVTHLYHHRGQFHLYLKQLGQPVDTDTIFTA